MNSRSFHKAVDFMVINKYSILGLGACWWVTRRFNNNMKELEKNTQEKKLYDPIKAKAQIQVYREIYNFEGADKGDDGALKILQSASDDDKETIKQYFNKNSKGKDQIDAEMERL